MLNKLSQNHYLKDHSGRLSLWIIFSFIVARSVFGFNKIAWGTGVWLGEYSLKWGMVFFFYTLFSLLLIIFVGLILWRREKFRSFFEKIIKFRVWLGDARWSFGILIFIAPVLFYQYTPWGLVFSDIYIRLLTCFFTIIGLAFLMSKGESLIGWIELLSAVLLISSEFVFATSFMRVTDYPFSLGWSEGNRLWDYSILFGSDLYDYDKKITPFLDIGRQFAGGIPFLLPVVTIQMERFWVALLGLLPYILFGLAAFHLEKKSLVTWALLTLWVLIFLIQGPIHPPLVFCAIAVALIWRRPLWYALPLVFAVGFLAVKSRFTWIFAPGIWISMLELAGASLPKEGKLPLPVWWRAICLGLAGVCGGYLGPKIVGVLAGDANASVAITTSSVTASVSEQPLLWYRLLPNATYGNGILIGLLLATLPLIIILLYLFFTKKWALHFWQGFIIISSLFAFLGVGLVVSTKIGGGGDLHNMDMFIIALLFTAVLAWLKAGKGVLLQLDLHPLWIRSVFIFLLFIPSIQSLRNMRSFSYAQDIPWLVTLMDISSSSTPSEKSMEMYPSKEIINRSLEIIRTEVDLAISQGGEVLFLDQRQLLTFGYIKNVPLVPEYEKKVLMNQALSSDEAYFRGFYDDLLTGRFQLIVSEPLRTPVQDSSFEFGEENNAWVKWVSIPVLCYYEPKETLQEVGVQLLVPRQEPVDCTSTLP